MENFDQNKTSNPDLSDFSSEDVTMPGKRDRQGTDASEFDEATMPGKRDRKQNNRFQIGDLIMRRYRVLAELGQGGMGVVYRCLDETAGVEIALKTLPPELSHNTLEMEQIRENFQLIHNLHHPGIASSNNLERNDVTGDYYLIMECCSGEDLRRYLRRKRKEDSLTAADIINVVKQVADALDYAHEMMVIHRDIKPGNIMIDTAGRVKILDFGLAAQIHSSMTKVSVMYHGTSGTGPYMAPEQWEGCLQDAKADQYALAVMTYEMISGHPPFESTDTSVLREAVLKSAVRPVGGVPRYVENALQRALSKDPGKRFTCCADFAAALEGGKGGGINRSGRMSFTLKIVFWFLILIIAAASGTIVYLLVNVIPSSGLDLAINSELPVGKIPAGISVSGKVSTPVKITSGSEQITPELKSTPVPASEVKSTPEAKSPAPPKAAPAPEVKSTPEAKSPVPPKAAPAPEVKSTPETKNPAPSETGKSDGKEHLKSESETLLKQLEALKDTLDKSKGVDPSDRFYLQAVKLTTEARRSYTAGSFSEALKNLRKAQTAYSRVVVESPVLMLGRLCSAARKSIMAKQWKYSRELIRRIRELDKEKADELENLLNQHEMMDKRQVPAAKKPEYDFSSIEVAPGVKIAMVRIPSGTFYMGSPAGETGRRQDEKQRKITLTKDFWMGKFEVTQAQFEAVMKYNPSRFVSPDRPVETISWEEAKRFCTKLNKLLSKSLPPGFRFDLPTEAQWEYACRGGTLTSLNSGEDMKIADLNNAPALDKVGWYGGNCGRDFTLENGEEISSWPGKQYDDATGGTHPVGKKAPNAWNLYDMHGNVWEWCRDWAGIRVTAASDPVGPPRGIRRVFRGGGWNSGARFCRSASRLHNGPQHKDMSLGFRLALVSIPASR